MRDYRTHLQTSSSAAPRPSNNALAAVNDPTSAAASDRRPPRESTSPSRRPRALDTRAQLRYFRAVQTCPSPRDQALALVPFYAGARISEIVALDIDDVPRSAHKGVLRILGKGEQVRPVPLHPLLQATLNGWLAERADWPGATDTPALFLNQRGQPLSVRGPTTSSPPSPRPRAFPPYLGRTPVSGATLVRSERRWRAQLKGEYCPAGSRGKAAVSA
ncbi:MAG: tyrosine recombinase XerC [Solirubrobacteraceae bacterium]